MKFAEILNAGQSGALRAAWEEAQPAAEFEPLPRGDYVATIVGGELETSRQGTPGYRLVFRIVDGAHTGRCVYHHLWLTPAAMPFAKRDLMKIGVTSLDQLDKPLPRGIRCRVHVVVHQDDQGASTNKVNRFEVLGIDAEERDEFHPDAGDSQGADDNA